jgi:5-methyltetrahydrofolate--homocysteine methyltransferase
MKNTYIPDWQKIYDRFEAWWNREELERPLMWITAGGKTGKSIPLTKPDDPAVKYLDVSHIINATRNYCEDHYFLADAFPAACIDLGPGSMALYLGSEPGFAWDTVWFKEIMDSPAEFETLHFDPQNKWWLKHLEIAREAAALSDGDFLVTIPDIIENLDILSALRGPQNFCFDIIDEGEAVHKGVDIIDSVYFKYYDVLHGILKNSDGVSAYTAFNILGKGKVAKVQCDFCAMISPDMFREFVQPSLRKQCQKLDHSLYHLDGPDAIKHVPALMEITELDALQWTCGAGKPDGGCEKWYPIYDQVRGAGKGLWIQVYDGGPEKWAESVQRLIQRYGKKGMYFLLPDFADLKTAEDFIAFIGKK